MITSCDAAGETLTDVDVLAAVAQVSKTAASAKTQAVPDLVRQLGVTPVRCVACHSGENRVLRVQRCRQMLAYAPSASMLLLLTGVTCCLCSATTALRCRWNLACQVSERSGHCTPARLSYFGPCAPSFKLVLASSAACWVRA